MKLKSYNKATAAVVAGSVVTLVGAFVTVDGETLGAIQTLFDSGACLARIQRGLKLMGKTVTAALLVLLLAACSAVLPDGAMTGQRLYAADGAYRALLELAVAYRDACDTRPLPFQRTCKPVVARLQEVDSRIATLRAGIDPATPEPLALQALEAALKELRAILVTGQSLEVE